MNKRNFLRSMLGAASLGLTSLARPKLSASEPQPGPSAPADLGRVLLLSSFVADFGRYNGQAVWPSLRLGDRLTLVRHNTNYDRGAVEVWWQDAMLGYLPSSANETVSQMADRGEPLYTAITGLQRFVDSQDHVSLEVWYDPKAHLPDPQCPPPFCVRCWANQWVERKQAPRRLSPPCPQCEHDRQSWPAYLSRCDWTYQWPATRIDTSAAPVQPGA